MSKEYLPLKVDPFRFADNGTCLQGTLHVKDMGRLITDLASDAGLVATQIQFGIDQQNLRFLQGNIETCLILQCQRCMESFKYEIMHNFKFGIVRTEAEASKLPAHYDPLIVKEMELSIQDVVEDELIVSLPIVAMHPQTECKVTLPLVSESEELKGMEKENPFKVIELLREKRERNK